MRRHIELPAMDKECPCVVVFHRSQLPADSLAVALNSNENFGRILTDRTPGGAIIGKFNRRSAHEG
jgi:hypothetical protein